MPTVVFGVSRTQLSTPVTFTKKEDGTFEAKIADLNPGTRYYFTISGKSPDGLNGSYNGLISTRGYPTEILITEGDVASAGARVKIGQQSYTTSDKGILSLGLAEGDYTGTATTDYSSKSIAFTVTKKPLPEDGSAPELQKFTFALAASTAQSSSGGNASLSVFTFIGILLVGTVVVGGGFFGYLIWRRKRLEGSGGGSDYQSAVVIDDGYNWKQRMSASRESQDEPYSLDHSSSTLPPQDGLPLPQTPPTARHNNSVYLNEEEPLDMFEAAKQHDAQQK